MARTEIFTSDICHLTVLRVYEPSVPITCKLNKQTCVNFVSLHFFVILRIDVLARATVFSDSVPTHLSVYTYGFVCILQRH